jgi:hypothetical protein
MIRAEVTGLRELSRALRHMSDRTDAELRQILRKIATVAADYIRPTVPSRTGKARRSVRAAPTRTAARITAGGRRAPQFPWLDFGGMGGRGKRNKRPFIAEGRYLFPGVERHREQTVEMAEDMLVDLGRSVGVDVDVV